MYYDPDAKECPKCKAQMHKTDNKCLCCGTSLEGILINAEKARSGNPLFDKPKKRKNR